MCPFHTELHFWGTWEIRHCGWCRHHEALTTPGLCAHHCLNPAAQGLLPMSRMVHPSATSTPPCPSLHIGLLPLRTAQSARAAVLVLLAQFSCCGARMLPTPGGTALGRSAEGVWDAQPRSAGALGEAGMCWVLSLQLQAPPARSPARRGPTLPAVPIPVAAAGLCACSAHRHKHFQLLVAATQPSWGGASSCYF